MTNPAGVPEMPEDTDSILVRLANAEKFIRAVARTDGMCGLKARQWLDRNVEPTLRAAPAKQPANLDQRLALDLWLHLYGLAREIGMVRNCPREAATIEAALRADLASSGWRDIADAPRDETKFLGWNTEYGARETYYRHYGDGSSAKADFLQGKGPQGSFSWDEPMNNWALSWQPTHWMPLPSPPIPTGDKP